LPSRLTARRLVWLALAGQVAFIASWVAAGALEPHYSAVKEYVSELGARNAAHPWIVDAGIAVFGASFIALGVALRRALPRRRAAVVACGLFAVAGLGILASGFLQMDCPISVNAHCRALSDAGALSWHHYGHLWTSFGARLLLVATPFAIAAALWPAPSGVAALSSGLTGLVIGTLSAFGASPGSDGLAQRASLGVLHLWVLIVAAGILHITRGPRPVSPLIPLRPREFMAASWSGEGELTPWPYFLGRRLARTCTAHREAVWISDRVWRFDDRFGFPDGRVMRRQTYCEFVGDDRVHLTAGDLPEGGRAWLEEGGYRLERVRMAFPLGPISISVLVDEHSYLAPDGTFVNAFEARSRVLHAPLARLVFRVRPRDLDLRSPAADEALA
jgi:hypothetical membrane protein